MIISYLGLVHCVQFDDTCCMHIYFSGIGGAGIGPLAEIAHKAGYTVSGSDKRDSDYIHYLQQHGITDIHIGQSKEAIAALHIKRPIDWFVYTSALTLENPNAPELLFCKDQSIKTSKRDELLNTILEDQHLALIAIAGTHGKTTTTAMVTWLFKQLNVPVSYLLPAKVSFGDMGEFESLSKYFIYEADEFDRNFLAFTPDISLITGVSWDHHELFPTRESYQEAFQEFVGQSRQSYIWQEDADYLSIESSETISVLDSSFTRINTLRLLGRYNRLDAWIALQTVHFITKEPVTKLIAMINRFPGLSRRMEALATNLYTDYAHTPEKIRGAMSVALEMATPNNQEVIVLYEPLTNRRQHYMIDDYKDCFRGASQVYWLPSYLAREDQSQRILQPSELIAHLTDPQIALPTERNEQLKKIIQGHLANGAMVVAMAGGGGNSLDEWLRREFTS
jgi:UDP-N-acetylmuramate--alanine ligase